MRIATKLRKVIIKMAIIRNCEICGKNFKASGNNHKTCSDCKRIAYRRWNKKRKQKQVAENLYNKPDHLAEKVKEINKYNKEHGTKYSYGMYKAMERLGKL